MLIEKANLLEDGFVTNKFHMNLKFILLNYYCLYRCAIINLMETDSELVISVYLCVVNKGLKFNVHEMI